MQTRELAQWVSEHTEEMYKWALYKTSSRELAEDLVQDTFLAAAEKISGFKNQSTPKTWLFSILNNKIVDFYRQKVKMPVATDNQLFSTLFDEGGDWKVIKRPRSWDYEEHILDNDDFRQILKKCMDALPDKWSISVKLKYLTGKNGEEICQELDITPTNFWQIVHRAKVQLRDCIENGWFKN
jgi:RNA polymerase sigma-70 factor (TIGR02943 family)